MSSTVLIPKKDLPAQADNLLPMGTITQKSDAATLLDCWEEALNQGVLWLNVSEIKKSYDGFFFFIVDENFFNGEDALTALKKNISIPGLSAESLNAASARGLLGSGRGVPYGAPAQAPDGNNTLEEDIATGFLAEESSFVGDFSLRLLREDTQEELILQGTSTLGRSSDCDVVVVDANRNISRHHCRISIDSGSYFIEDLNSANGTFVSGNRIRPGNRIELRANDTLSLADVPFQII